MSNFALTYRPLTPDTPSCQQKGRRALKARELRDKKSPYQAVLDDPANTEYESIPLEACEQYVTLLNLRNWEKIGDRYVTEQIYVHTKLMIVDDRFVLLGSANVNDRSMTGERDSEIAALMIDTSASTCDIGACGKKPVRTFARELRMGIWKKLFGITGKVRPASHLLKAIEQPASPASWQAIQKQAKANTAAYEKAFPFIPRNDASILPTWNKRLQELSAPVPGQSKFWQQPQFKADGVAGLEQIKGFITALPIYWTGKENLDFGVPTAILVNNDAPIDDELKPDAEIAVGSAEGPEGESHA